MGLTIDSVLTTILLDSLLMLALCFFFQIEWVSRRIKPECMVGILLTVIFRLFLPLEFPYTHTIRIKDFLTPFRRALIYPVITVPVTIRIWHLICAVWAVGTVLTLAYKIYKYYGYIKLMAVPSAQSWEEVLSECGLAEAFLDEVKGIRLVVCGQFASPFVLGVRNPTIVLPKKGYSKLQMRYILSHELMHIRKKDILWKVIVDLLCAVLWWNPVQWYLRKQLFILIEMRNDMRITETMSKAEKVEYANCLAEIFEEGIEKDIAFGVSLCSDGAKRLKRRLKLVLGENAFSRGGQIAAWVLCGIALVLSSAIIFEPYSLDMEEGTPLTESDMYLIRNGSQYDVYVYGAYIMTTDSLEGFDGVEICENNKEPENAGERNIVENAGEGVSFYKAVKVWCYKEEGGIRYMRLYDAANGVWLTDWIPGL